MKEYILYGNLKELESIKTHANAFTLLANSQKQQARGIIPNTTQIRKRR